MRRSGLSGRNKDPSGIASRPAKKRVTGGYRERWLVIVLLLVVAGINGCGPTDERLPAPDSEVTRVHRRAFVAGIEDVGIVRATRSASVVATAEGKIARMVPEGTHVRAGDPVLWLDDQDIRQNIETETIALKRSQSDLERARELLSESRFNLELTLREREATYRFNVLNVERSERELARLQDRYTQRLIPENELMSQEAVLDQDRLQETRSRLAMERARAEVGSKIKSLQTDLAIAEQEYERSRFSMDDLLNRQKKMVLPAPRDGVIVVRRNWRKEPFKVGDLVWEGIQVLEIPDLSEFHVWTQVPEAYFQRISTGQTVSIRVPALDNLELEGRIESISWLAMPRVLSRGTGYTSEDSSEGEPVFEVQVTLSIHHTGLKTGMNVRTLFVEHRVPDVLIAPASAVAENDDGWFVYVQENGRFIRRKVKVGQGNRTERIIEAGIEDGQRIAVYNPGKGN
ncbi:efflux RND transporter periplasmic adaptor subunit [bacterium]|nr:efflux RND transporter periplasmic adaptor subunit [candidate division CSSED10-310 bacterium]